MALMKCPECEREISDKAYSCPHCGFPMKQVSIEQVENLAESCRYCGEENPINSDYCEHCGMRLTAYSLVKQESSATIESYQDKSLLLQQEQLYINTQLLEHEKIKEAQKAHCPKCGSTSLTGNKKGFGIGKAVLGAGVLGPFGLVAGNINAKKVIVTCMNCGHKFKP